RFPARHRPPVTREPLWAPVRRRTWAGGSDCRLRASQVLAASTESNRDEGSERPLPKCVCCHFVTAVPRGLQRGRRQKASLPHLARPLHPVRLDFHVLEVAPSRRVVGGRTPQHRRATP